MDKDVQMLFKDAYALHKKINLPCTEELKDKVADLKAIMPAIMDLGNPNMRSRHWEKVFKLVGKEYVEGMDFDLKMLLNGKIMDFKDQIGEISGTASGESQLEMSLEKIVKAWENQNFIVLNHRDQHNLFILGSLEEIFTLLEDNQVTLQTMLGSRFIKLIQDEVELWSKKLANFSETLDEWLVCQKTWMYLENIFGAEDIQKQLPAESQKFLVVDRSWKQIMTKTNKNPLCMASMELEEGAEITLLDQFNMNNAALDSIQKSLEEYLETKRMAFPRFYFLSNDELLEILSQTRDPHAVQPHMVNEEVKAVGPVENWLLAFEKGMRTSLYDQCKHAYPAQVVIAIDQTMWTWNGEAALKKITMKDFLDFSLKQIDAMVDLVRMPLDKQQRTLLGALLTIDVHARDVTRALHKQNVGSRSDFMWTKQLRYEWDEKLDDVVAKQTIACFQYGYEYLGNGPRLVITPLTDLCYMTLTGALHMRLGGAPAGPAGTGKTETTKDLAKALANFCVVFNCSDGLDYKIMGRFFSGLAQQGACLKEFDFEGRMIPLNYSFGVFITMNPGYAGRTELPDNLKSLFRPVAMMVPDYRLIAEIMLFSEEQLSKQSHYDFGMRAVKTVLVAAGQLKRKEPDTFEDLLLIRAMRDSNVPKFLEQDIPLFSGILKDLFPGVQVPYVDYGKLQEAIETALVNNNLQKVPSFISKVIQVHETQLVRHALSMLKEEVDRLILNPKSIHAGELYGEFNLATNEWRDGIVPKLVRGCVDQLNEGSDNRKWVIFDGPVDAVWIENMNTVLDDNKMLCLANSERIKLPNTMHMLFEVQDLKVASPATVSRCGMVYMEQVHVGMLSLVRTWASTTLKELTGLRNANKILATIEAHLEACMDFIRYECKEKVIAEDNDLMTALVVWSITWSVGANIVDADRPKFDNFCRNRFQSVLQTNLLPDFRYDPAVPYFNILVPTVETTKYRYVLERLMSAGNNVLFMAETGVGKSVVMNAFLNDMVAKGTTVSYSMGYSAQTKPANLRDVLESKLEKKRKTLLGPPSGKKMFLFIDDLNMPALETYGAQPPNELLRQLIDQGGFYDVNKLFFKNVQDVIVCSAAAPPGGGRNEVSPRLLRHFHMIWLTNLSIKAMHTIFTSIVRGYMNIKLGSFVSLAEKMVHSSVDIYMRIQKELLPTPSKSHYTFNLRDLSKVFQGLLMQPEWTHENFADIIFGDFMTKENKEYQELEDREKVNAVLNEYLEEYNLTFPSRMDLVFFRDAINHISRVARVLSQPRGNALLVGVGGSGRQSLARMASFMADFKCRQIEITRGYGMNEWHENLREILMNAGAKNQPTVFLFSDTQIVNETFLEDLNNILNSGEVPNLYAQDELEKIVGMVRPLAKKVGIETRDENLHVILCMSPIGANFRTHALYSVAHRLFESQTQLGIGPYVESLSTMCNKMHRTVEVETANFFQEVKRYNYTTPTSYLELIKLYVDTLKTQQEKISNNERRYRVGLDKLKETEEVVAKLEEELTLMKPVLEKASIDTEALLVSVTADQKDADEQAAIVQVDDDCQADLDEAMPAYEAAIKALQTLDKKSIQEMKSFANPPEMVKFTLEAVCLLFGVEKKAIDKDSWGEGKKVLNNSDFLDQCKNYDKDNIKKKVMKSIMPYYKDERFQPELVKAQSSAAMCLCAWVRAMVVYDKVAKGIEPKKAALKSAEDSLAVTMAELKTQDKKAELEAQANKAKVQLVRAGQLLGGLGGEKIRWNENATKLNAALTNLVGDMCLAAACMAYLGPFTSQFRARIIDGLPADDFSCENGLLTTMGRRWPLMIDPQGQANRWVRNMYANSNLQIIKLTEKEFLRTLENGQELDPSLEPVLLKQVFKKAGQMLLRLGDTDVPYSDEFKFMITTKLANPHYMPEICIKVTVINFTVTMKGLEDQLLVDVIKNERPDLEERKDQLVVSIANDQKQLLDIEEQILSMLANASGNILDDEELIDALALSKKTSTAINARLQEAETTTLEINTTREGYRSVATRGSVIYFVVANLAMVDPMYQYSLQFYKALVNTRLQKTEKKEVLQERLDLLIADITESIYLNVCRGLFEKDKLVFAFIIAANIDRQKKIVTEEEFLMFMVGPIPDAGVMEANPFDETSMDIFKGLSESFVADPSAWAQFLTTDTPDSDTLPGDWEGRLNSFQRLLIVRALREEKITSAIRRYVGENIGAFFCASPPFDLEGSYNDSTCTTPLIFILSPGADPTDYLVNLAEAKGKSGGGLRIISLGQGQGPIAERAVDSAQKMGDWVCLQNCHLAVSWLSKLESIVETMQNDPSAVNDQFRLWLTSMPSDKFPVPVLQNGLKVTNEPPRGIKANLQRTFADISSDDYESYLKAAMRQVKMYVEESTDGIPWETLNVSVCAVTYGGRVTDMWDKRTVASILINSGGEYYAPAEGTVEEVRAYITSLPAEDKPDALLNTVVTCAGEGSGGGGGDGNTDSKVAEIAVRISDRMPKQYDLRKAHPDSFKRGGEDNASLHQLQRAIKGEVVMDGVLENMYQCFIFQKVPPAWENAGYPCLKPLPSWGFMTAVKQTYSRNTQIAVDTLRIASEMTDKEHHDITEPPEIGAYIYGIFMEGGRFDRESMQMAESQPRALLDDLPSILLLPVISEEYHPENVYNCPLYKTSLRAGTLSTTGHSTNFVVTMTVPSMKEEDHWVRRGCAMLCMRDD
eukprot:GSChrysophyteH2.ASY1.ANO1.1126.1 assembled CDS